MKNSFLSSLLLLSSISTGLAGPSQSPRLKQHAVQRARKMLIKGGHLALRSDNGTQGSSPPVETTSCTAAKPVRAPNENVWTGLTDGEAAAVTAWLFAQSDLNLTTSDSATPWDNTMQVNQLMIQLVELMPPNKTDVLAYLDGNATAPTRFAHVVLATRATLDPTYDDILVGPLPVDNRTTKWSRLEYPYTRKTQGRVQNLDADSDAIYNEWLNKIASGIVDIQMALWGRAFTGNANDTVAVYAIDPLWQDDGRIVRWDAFWSWTDSGFDVSTLLPLGLYLRSDVTGRDPANWKLEGWLYNDVFYETTDEFRAAFNSPGFERLKPNLDGPWAHTDRAGPVLPFDAQSPPVMVAPSGPRYAVDVARKYVEWMGFSFYIGFSRDTGLVLHDIKYKGQRILYELGMQEALAHYAGNDPFQSSTAYVDSYYGFGPVAFELVKGYDCPTYATYLNSSFYVTEETRTHLDSICLFEYDADYPMARHTSWNYVSARKNTYFTVRSVSTVGNYDYALSYSFHQDGTIGVDVRASGYIQSAYYAKNEDYGWQIHDALSGSMHDHVLNFKADFDVLGTDNSMMLVSQVPVTKKYKWSKTPRNTMQLQRKYLTSEDESRMFWGENSSTQFLVVNRDSPNKYGVPRGYRIAPSAPTAHLTVQDSTNLQNAARWAEYDVQVTRQHDSEPRSANPYNNMDVSNPPINFNKFFNGESLDQEDLVVWVNLGMHHVPHTGDIPNTIFTTAHSGVTFSPLNYFDDDVAKQTVNMVRVTYGQGKPSRISRFGQGRDDAKCPAGLNYQPLDANLEGYRGDVVMRKYPYNPDEAYYDTDSIS